MFHFISNKRLKDITNTGPLPKPSKSLKSLHFGENYLIPFVRYQKPLTTFILCGKPLFLIFKPDTDKGDPNL